MIYVGIDPGASGGLAWTGTTVNVNYTAMPDTPADLWAWLRQIPKYRGPGCVHAVIEKVWGHVGADQPGSAMFNFGRNYGLCIMALTAAGIPYEEVVPRRWQAALSIPPRERGETKTQWKNRLKAKAQALYPGASVTLATADALLIAEYCRRTRGTGA